MPFIGFLVTLVIYCIILYLFWWVLSLFTLPDPADKIKIVIFVLVCVLILLGLVTGSVPLIPFQPRG